MPGHFDTCNGDAKLLRNVGIRLPSDALLNPGRRELSPYSIIAALFACVCVCVCVCVWRYGDGESVLKSLFNLSPPVNAVGTNGKLQCM